MMDDLKSSLENVFDEYGVDFGRNKAGIIVKTALLCQTYGLEAEEFVESWMACAARNSLNEVTTSGLDMLEREDLSARKENAKKVVDETYLAEIQKKTSVKSKVEVFGNHTFDTENDVEFDHDSSEIFRAYGDLPPSYSTTPKAEKKPSNLVKANVEGTPKGAFTPVGFSPAVNSKSVSYSARAKAGESVSRYKCKDSDYWNELADSKEPVKVTPVDPTKRQLESDKPFKYMFQKTVDMASTLNKVLTNIGYDMVEEEMKDDDDDKTGVQDLRESSAVDGLYLGKICSLDGKLTSGSIYFEGDIDISGGHIVALDITKVEEYRLFSGQVVLVKGQNELGKCLRVSEIILPKALPMPTLKPAAMRPLNMIIACGPYTTIDSFLYEPLLIDLVQVIKRDKPDLCILMGPFIDFNHPMIANGEIAEEFDELFDHIVEKLKSCVEDLKTHIVLVSNHRDAHHHVVFPTPQYVSDSKKDRLKITFLPDPAVIEVGGITIGLMTNDILFHLANNEIAKSTVSDRLGGLSKHILSQRNFYPLYPPDSSIPFDVNLWAQNCIFNVTPHILVLPSDLRYFIKEVDGTIVVNPERLTKKSSGGTYARLQVKMSDNYEGNSIADFCCGEIIKI